MRVDFPKNLQQTKAHPVWPETIDLPGFHKVPKADDVVLNEIIGLIEKSERPVLYCGGGVLVVCHAHLYARSGAPGIGNPAHTVVPPGRHAPPPVFAPRNWWVSPPLPRLTSEQDPAGFVLSIYDHIERI